MARTLLRIRAATAFSQIFIDKPTRRWECKYVEGFQGRRFYQYCLRRCDVHRKTDAHRLPFNWHRTGNSASFLRKALKMLFPLSKGVLTPYMAPLPRLLLEMGGSCWGGGKLLRASDHLITHNLIMQTLVDLSLFGPSGF